ncbi:hypothetical protein BJ085DRAFT_30611 [Dimargaris cristalligena]|uniref:F-box domain-containing protein n=1 Tax=Dimargaris cristalligena TaxID=215637 RepID=A0A4P9ZYE1_9FUNG|nr:hypothetical protein BJ085DRAFT_30611 [Dimargaris cristalligena]|eukprot:RKP38388.1 hypothetical protein BJ085DRAFT_30611 [Dimargaris cristalligena]
MLSIWIWFYFFGAALTANVVWKNPDQWIAARKRQPTLNAALFIKLPVEIQGEILKQQDIPSLKALYLIDSCYRAGVRYTLEVKQRETRADFRDFAKLKIQPDVNNQEPAHIWKILAKTELGGHIGAYTLREYQQIAAQPPNNLNGRPVSLTHRPRELLRNARQRFQRISFSALSPTEVAQAFPFVPLTYDPSDGRAARVLAQALRREVALPVAQTYFGKYISQEMQNHHSYNFYDTCIYLARETIAVMITIALMALAKDRQFKNMLIFIRQLDPIYQDLVLWNHRPDPGRDSRLVRFYTLGFLLSADSNAADYTMEFAAQLTTRNSRELVLALQCATDLNYFRVVENYQIFRRENGLPEFILPDRPEDLDCAQEFHSEIVEYPHPGQFGVLVDFPDLASRIVDFDEIDTTLPTDAEE